MTRGTEARDYGDFSEKAKTLGLAERAGVAEQALAVWPNPKTRNRSLYAAMGVFLAEHPGATTVQVARAFFSIPRKEAPKKRLLLRVGNMLHTMRGRGFIRSDKEPRFVTRASFGARWTGPANGPGVLVHDHTARWFLYPDPTEKS